MRENKNLTSIMFGLSTISFIVAVIFNYFIEEPFIVNVSLAIFGSSLLAALVALITYFANKKAILKEQGDILIKLINLFNEYEYELVHTENTLKENVHILVQIHSIAREELFAKRWEYCPFIKQSQQDKFLFSSVDYINDFLTSIKDEIHFLKNVKVPNKLLYDYMTNIDNAIYIKTNERMNEDGEISAATYENIIAKEMSEYLKEYLQVIMVIIKANIHY